MRYKPLWKELSNRVELADVVTADGLRLDGAFYEGRSQRTWAGIDAFIVMHGSLTHFADSVPRFLGEGMAMSGYPTLALSNRGTRFAWQAADGSYFGHAFENVDESRLDLRAAIDWLVGRGMPRVGLLGHSLGGLKAVHYAAHEKDDRVKAIVALAAPSFSHSALMRSPAREAFVENYRRARNLLEKGRAFELMEVTFPKPGDHTTMMTAWTYDDKYGPAERYNLVANAHSIRVPFLYLIGAREPAPLIRGLERLLVDAARNAPNRRGEVIPEADHFFIGQEEMVLAAIRDWLMTLD